MESPRTESGLLLVDRIPVRLLSEATEFPRPSRRAGGDRCRTGPPGAQRADDLRKTDHELDRARIRFPIAATRYERKLGREKSVKSA